MPGYDPDLIHDGNRLRIAVVSRTNYFDDYRNALVRVFRENGCEAEGLDRIETDFNPDCFVVINPFLFEGTVRDHRRFLYVGIQTEQLDDGVTGAKYFGGRNNRRFHRAYRHYDFFIEWSRPACVYLNRRFANVYHVPHGGFSELETPTHLELVEEDYDLIFIGNPFGIRNRRREILTTLEKRFKVYPKYVDLWGDERTRAILRSRICLNIHYENSLVFESPRLYEYLCKRRFVLSEPVWDSFPFVDGIDYVSCYAMNLVDQIEKFLEDVEARRRVAESGHRRTLEVRIDLLAKSILDRINMELSLRKSKAHRIRKSVFHRTGSDWLMTFGAPFES